MWVSSLRMYGAGPQAKAAWRALFGQVFADLGLDIGFIDHGWPEPIASLWQRPDLGCDFMCGWPFLKTPGLQAIAAPAPSPDRYEGLSRYCSEFLVREDAGWHELSQAFGHRFGWMASDSQSGFNAPRASLSQWVTPQRPALFSEVRGPLGTPVRTLAALRSGEVDMVALDSYFLDLCRLHQPELMSGLRSLASTAWTPMPLLVAAAGVPLATVEALRARLLTLHESPVYTPLLERVLLRRFVPVDLTAYQVLRQMEDEAVRRGYGKIR